MRIWQKDNCWDSGMPLKWLVLRDLSPAYTKPWANLCLKIKNGLVE